MIGSALFLLNLRFLFSTQCIKPYAFKIHFFSLSLRSETFSLKSRRKKGGKEEEELREVVDDDDDDSDDSDEGGDDSNDVDETGRTFLDDDKFSFEGDDDSAAAD